MRSKIDSFIKPISPSLFLVRGEGEAERPSMAAQPRRRKADEPSSFSGIKVPAPVEKKSRVGTSVKTVPESQATSAGVNLRIVQAKNAAVAQAQKDGATGSYRIFDSPFGNYLVPVKSPLPRN